MPYRAMDLMDRAMDQMDGAMDQMDGPSDDAALRRVKRPPLNIDDMSQSLLKPDVTSSEANKSESFPRSTKAALSTISDQCWLCTGEPHQAAHVLGQADTSVLLLPRTSKVAS